uniref:Uncharacterized protein n=1 Tax=Setaria italica TaxID=4555 RepID=K3Y0N9_SETIT
MIGSGCNRPTRASETYIESGIARTRNGHRSHQNDRIVPVRTTSTLVRSHLPCIRNYNTSTSPKFMRT